MAENNVLCPEKNKSIGSHKFLLTYHSSMDWNLNDSSQY